MALLFARVQYRVGFADAISPFRRLMSGRSLNNIGIPARVVLFLILISPRTRPDLRSDMLEHKTPTLIPRIGARIRKVPSMKNGGEKSGTRERAQVGASDLQASPLAEGHRKM